MFLEIVIRLVDSNVFFYNLDCGVWIWDFWVVFFVNFFINIGKIFYFIFFFVFGFIWKIKVLKKVKGFVRSSFIEC